MTTDGIRLILTCDAVGGHAGGPQRREGASYPPGTALRRALADPAVAGFPELGADLGGEGSGERPGAPAPTDADAPDWSKRIWLVQIVRHEGDSEGVVVGVTSRSSGLLLGAAHKRDTIGELSADGQRLVVHFSDAGETQRFGSVFNQILGSRRRPWRTPRGRLSDSR